ncbi:hypothetical protein SLS58_009950 [Diplodia intermedia]|uniref:Xylanolytic transcriptional activator regulatory domain-containing protein n=1 Tax=Diplodia intermedia TaxID=856260 RepID=A0ABR3T9N5_9PEZI
MDDTLECYESRIDACQGVALSDDSVLRDAHYHGPFSSRAFAKQLDLFLATVLHQPLHNIEQADASSSALAPFGGLAYLSLEDQISCDWLSKAQQDYLLDLFWSQQHTLLPMVDKAEFQLHYESLWSEPSLGVSFRKPSPLVDIVLALCIQYGTFRIGGNEPNQCSQTDVEDSRLTGRIYFQRCHALLSEQSTTTAPSITAVQCHAYSVQYLLNAGLPNTAHAHLAAAVQTAHATGLHHEPPAHLSPPQKELRRRLWWSLYMLDSTTSIALGRPHLMHLATATVRLPNDSRDVAHALGPCYMSPSRDVTWLSFHSQALLLVDTARAIAAAFADKATDILAATRTRDFRREPYAREKG